VLLDQIDLTKGGDASGEVVEEASGRERQTLAIGGQPT